MGRPDRPGPGPPSRGTRTGVDVRGVQPRRPAPSPAARMTRRCGCGTPRPVRTRATLQGHTGRGHSVAFSPDGQTLASGQSGPDGAAVGRQDRPEPGPPSRGTPAGSVSVAFSPDGTLACASRLSDDKTVRLWDAETGQDQRATLQGHTGGVSSVAFSPDGQTPRQRLRGQDGAAVGRQDRPAAWPPSRGTTAEVCLRGVQPRRPDASPAASVTRRCGCGTPDGASSPPCKATAANPGVQPRRPQSRAAAWMTRRCGCGTRQPASQRHPPGAHRLVSCPWRSAPTATPSPAAAPRTRRCGCGTPHRPGARPSSRGTRTGSVSVAFSPDGQTLASAWLRTRRCGCGTPKTGQATGHPPGAHGRGALRGVQPRRPDPGLRLS